jgi:hypothetical protein
MRPRPTLQRPRRPALVCAAIIIGTLPAQAADHFVDANGAIPGSFGTIAAAMAQASPGDRILVAPGVYPAFQFERGVEVLGLGDSPADVTVARVDFHVSVPNQDYDAVLSNLTVCGSSPLDAISISGNELARGTLIVDGVRTCGGVFLAGDAEFQLIMQNTRIEPALGGGFLGAAMDFGGGYAELVDVAVLGWDAAFGVAAGHALRVSNGAVVRATACELLGGFGSAHEGPGAADGGDAVTGAPWPGPVGLVLAGGSVLRGGDAAAGGEGGAGARVRGTPGSLVEGAASVTGGTGSPAGMAWAWDGAVPLGFDPTLTLAGGSSPGGAAPGDRSVRYVAGDLLDVRVHPSIAATSRLTLFTEVEPAASNTGPLPGHLHGPLAPRIFPMPALSITVPGVPPVQPPRPRLFLVFQAVFDDPSTGQPLHSNPVVVRIDG